MVAVCSDLVLVITVFVGAVLDLTGGVPAVKYYASKYDHIDVEAILNNRRLVNYYSACLLNKGPCPPEGIEFKRILPEALESNCARCSEKQATVALRAIRRLKKEYPKVWAQLMEQWDRDDIFVKKFESTYGAGGLPGKTTSVVPVAIGGSSNISSQPTSTTTDVRLKLTTTTVKATFKTTTSTTTTSKPFSLSSAFSNSNSESPKKPNTKITIGTISNRPFSTSSSSSRPITTNSPISNKDLTSTPKTVLVTKITTNRPITRDPFDAFLNNNPPVPLRPFSTLGNNIGATVSGLVRGIGALGTRVVETGAEVADVIFRNLARPLSL